MEICKHCEDLRWQPSSRPPHRYLTECGEKYELFGLGTEGKQGIYVPYKCRCGSQMFRNVSLLSDNPFWICRGAAAPDDQ